MHYAQRPIHRLIFLTTLTVLLMLVGACSDDESDSSSTPPTATDRASLCADTDGVDEEALPAMPRVCFEDIECPCGTHCDLGRCVSACSDDAECDGNELCDDFGRCRTVERANRSGGDTPQRAGKLRLSRSTISMYEHDGERTVRIGARHHNIERLRLRADEGLEIACGDADFSDECHYEDLEADADDLHVRIRPREGEDFSEGAHHEIHVFGDNGRETITVRTNSTREHGEEVAGRPGIYEGYAWPEGSGFASRRRQNEFADEIRQLRIPVEIIVYPSEDAQVRVAHFDDGLGLLFPNGDTVGQFEGDSAEPWTLSTPRQVYSDADSRPHTDAPILTRGESQSVEWTNSRLIIEHRASFEGIIPGERSPYVDWTISTTLVEAFDDDEQFDVPDVPEGHSPVDTEAEIQEPLVLEELVADYYGWEADDFDSHSDYVSALLCNEYPTSSGGLSPLTATLFSENLYEFLPGIAHPAGELACETGEPPKAFELLNDTVLDVYKNLETCFEDWERAEDSRRTNILDTTASDCVDEPRFIKALTVAQHADRARALGDGSISDPRSSALAHRLMQQWLSLHTFTGGEFAKIETFNVVVPAAQAVDLENSRLDIIDRIARGFDLILTPRIASAAAYLPTTIVAAPDYRNSLFPGVEYPPQRTHDQQVGIPVAMLQTYDEQLSAIGDFLEDVQYARSDFDEIEEPTEEAIRRGLLVMAMAQGLYDEMRVGGEPAWQHEWDIAWQRVGARLTGVMRQMEDARNMVNPLGISDVDLPLYRIGDQQATIQRFSAISDFLVGTGPADPAVAPAQVEHAYEVLEGARTAWLENVERDLEVQLLNDEQERRIETIRRNYGSQVNGLCGGTGFDNIDVLSHRDQINGSDCYLAPHCSFEIDDYTNRVGAADLGQDLCVTSMLRERLGTSITTGNADLDEILDTLGELYDTSDESFSTVYGESLPMGRIQLMIEDSSGSTIEEFELDPDQLRQPSTQIPENIPEEVIEDIQQVCESHRQHSESQRPDSLPDTCEHIDDCPVGYFCDDGSCEHDADETGDDPQCYSGSLGEMALEVRALSTAVDSSRAKLYEYSERYDNAMQSCIIIAKGNEAKAEERAAHNDTMRAMEFAKLASDSTAHIAAAARHSAGADSILTFGATALFAGTEAIAQTVSSGLAMGMDQATRGHENTMAAIDAEVQEQTCFNDAEMHLIGMQSAAIDLQRATQELSQQLVAFENMKGSVQGLLREGRLELQNELDRTRAPIDIDFWLDDRILTFERHMRAARRATYLAVMAVEYEYQFSSAERLATLAAQTPEELDRVLSNLRAFTMTGNIGGSNPGDLLAVVSLRDHILQLGDRGDSPPGFYQMSSEERFEALLTSPQLAVYDDGEYLGQEIPFQLAPMGRQALGDSQGISLLAGTDCAERLWSANLTLQGEDLYQNDDPSFTRVVLRKRNTFYSQWCDAEQGSEEQPHQLASTRPSRNLFVDPYARDESTTPVTVGFDGNEIDAFSNARISAYFNIPRYELESEAYAQGGTTELAGRGLYGDYAIFFPAETISEDGSRGLLLENIDDILLRVDYVSVSQ